jgi:hypothetical protein
MRSTRTVGPSHSVKPVAKGCTALPVTYLIVPSVEDRFRRTRSEYRREQDARFSLQDWLISAYAHMSRDRSRRAAQRATHHAPLRRSTSTLERACKHLSDVDLEVAWQAALRGDRATFDARVLPHVDPRPPKRAPEGTPWRESMGLSRRTT